MRFSILSQLSPALTPNPWRGNPPRGWFPFRVGGAMDVLNLVILRDPNWAALAISPPTATGAK